MNTRKEDTRSFVVSARVDIRHFVTVMTYLLKIDPRADVTRSGVVSAAVTALAEVLEASGKGKVPTYHEAFRVLEHFGFKSSRGVGKYKLADILAKESQIIETYEQAKALMERNRTDDSDFKELKRRQKEEEAAGYISRIPKGLPSEADMRAGVDEGEREQPPTATAPTPSLSQMEDSQGEEETPEQYIARKKREEERERQMLASPPRPMQGE